MFLIAICSLANENLFPEKMCRNFQHICMSHSEQVNWFNSAVLKMLMFTSVHFSFLLPINAYLVFHSILSSWDSCEATYCPDITVFRIINSWTWIFTLLCKCLHKICRSQLNVCFMWYNTSLFSQLFLKKLIHLSYLFIYLFTHECGLFKNTTMYS